MISEKQRAANRAYATAHPGDSARRHRVAHARNPNKRRQRQKAWAKAHPEKTKAKSRRNWLKRRYKMTPADYDRMFTQQGGRCAVCNQPFVKTATIDHCHQTNKVRGLLCTFCNVAVGVYERLGEAIAAYLNAPKPTENK